MFKSQIEANKRVKRTDSAGIEDKEEIKRRDKECLSQKLKHIEE